MSALRQRLRGFIRRIHPDVISVVEARSVNTVAMQHLNAYIDVLDSDTIWPSPFVGQTLSVFVLRTNGRLRPASLAVGPIPPGADFIEKRRLGEILVSETRRVEELVDSATISPPLVSAVRPLLNAPQEKWRRLWESETRRERHLQLLSEISFDAPVSLLRRGFNPNFVFFSRKLNPTEGLNRLAGLGMQEPEVWLLENIFRLLRESDPPVPVVLSDKYDANSPFGFLEIPADFVLREFAEFVEDHVDEVRTRRKKALQVLSQNR
jgi:hypothetical protein